MTIEAKVQTVVVDHDGSGELRLIDRSGKNLVSTFKSSPKNIKLLTGHSIQIIGAVMFLGDRWIAIATFNNGFVFVSNDGFTRTIKEAKRP